MISKIDEIKDLKYGLKKYKRVHVNHFVDYEHHDKIYGRDKIKRYSKILFRI